jgi:hypothetical protein
MMFGYMVVRALLPLVKIINRLPDSGRVFAAVLDAATTPFNVINYWGSCGGARLYSTQRMGRLMFDACRPRRNYRSALVTSAKPYLRPARTKQGQTIRG